MHSLQRCIVFLSLLAFARPCDPNFVPDPVKAKASLSSGNLHVFSEESVQLNCGVPDEPLSNWDFQWFFNDNFNEPVAFSQVLDLSKARVQQSGTYTCMGIKEIKCYPYDMPTNKSDPIHIEVDGGWVLLQIPHEPIIVDDKLTLTCRIRDHVKLREVIFYKEGVEIHKSPDSDLVFKNAVLQDGGKYSCMATWQQGSELHSAKSSVVSVQVLDKVTTPIIEFSKKIVKVGDVLHIKCITHVNAREEGLEVEYYFLKDNEELGPAFSRNTYQISHFTLKDKGSYSCRVRVRALNEERLSKDKGIRVRF